MIALFFDTETTGFKSSTFTPEIVQIGAVVQDTETKRILAELNFIITAKNPIPKTVSDIHGITDDISSLYGVDTRAASLMFGLMVQMSDVVVAHNISFDLGIIKDAWPVASAFLETKEQYCTMRNCSRFDDIPRRHAGKKQFTKLADAYRYFYDKDFENAHDAMADVRACRDVYFALMER
jgi:DNA polymerase-3 subunit epsilon